MLLINRKSAVVAILVLIVAIVLPIWSLLSDESPKVSQRNRITSASRVGTEWWYEGLPPEWYQGEIDPDRDLPESVSAIGTVPDLVQQSLSGSRPVVVRGY